MTIGFSERLRELSAEEIRMCSYIRDACEDSLERGKFLDAIGVAEEDYLEIKSRFDSVFPQVKSGRRKPKKSQEIVFTEDIGYRAEAKYRYVQHLVANGVTLDPALSAAKMSFSDYKGVSRYVTVVESDNKHDK